MISRTWSRKAIAFCLALAVWSVYSMVVLASPGQQGMPAGELSVSGKVTVNGQSAISGATVFSDSTVTTAENSSATLSLGRTGRIEILPDSSVKVSFTESGIMASLDAGKIRVSTPAGVSANIMTADGSVIASPTQDNGFTVDVECGNTFVATHTGHVEMRGGNQVKQIAAGQDDTMGTQQPGTRCTRLQTEGMRGISGGALALLLLAAGGAIAVALWTALTDNNDLNFGGTPVVVSPTK